MKKTLGIIALVLLSPIILLIGFVLLTILTAEVQIIIELCGGAILVIAGIVAVVFLIRYLKNR